MLSLLKRLSIYRLGVEPSTGVLARSSETIEMDSNLRFIKTILLPGKPPGKLYHFPKLLSPTFAHP